MSAHPFSARLFLIPALAGALLVSACQNNGDGSSGMNKENVGTLLGGIGGAVLGAQFGSGTGRLVGVAAGALAGAYLGNQIGSSLDKADKAEMEKASTRATTAPIGQPISWRNPDCGNSGTVTPTRDGSAAIEFASVWTEYAPMELFSRKRRVMRWEAPADDSLSPLDAR